MAKFKSMSREEIHQITVKLAIIKSELISLGLTKTFNAMDTVTSEIGWEAQEIINGTHPMIDLKEA